MRNAQPTMRKGKKKHEGYRRRGSIPVAGAKKPTAHATDFSSILMQNTLTVAKRAMGE